MLCAPVPCKFGEKGLQVIEMSEYKEMVERSKICFATLQEQLICKLSSEEARKSQTGVQRPHPFDAFCPTMMENWMKSLKG